tara:strand:+ start:787 stop:2025 length:1239 start_codon:yes stop_codon:yes gene_type:complete
MNLVSTSRISNYWEKFPLALRIIIKARLWTAIGAGGVLYLSPIIFNSLNFSAEQIGSGFTAAALAGISTRSLTGYLLDKKYSYKNAINLSCLIAIISDFILFYSQSYLPYLVGQFFLGAAAGIYWPSVELAIPLNCNYKINSSEGYAIARSADAVGVTVGALLGTIGTYFQFSKIIYIIDIICMLYIYIFLTSRIQSFKNKEYFNKIINKEKNYHPKKSDRDFDWLIRLSPLLLITIYITSVMTLLQSLLPLDLAYGGIIRPPIIESRVATLLSIKLILLAILQWPLGYLIRHKTSYFKFRLCLMSLLIGFLLLVLSNFLINGYLIIIIAFIPITIALCIFLPSASDAIVKSSPTKYRGSALALYSQCFGISALSIPLIAGKLLDSYNTAIQIWLIMCLLCILLIPISKKIK